MILALLLAALPPLVPARTLVPDLVERLAYATETNFLKQRLYPEAASCLLREPVARRLARVAERLRKEDGTRLVVWDCYRPHSVQERMWTLFPHRGYVANPRPGSAHNRGGAVDVTLADARGVPLAMPSAFDDFSRKSWRSYEGGTTGERHSRDRLRAAMEAEGFQSIRMEWWHFEDPEAKAWPVLDQPLGTDPRGN